MSPLVKEMRRQRVMMAVRSAQIAAMIGVHRHTVSLWENGARDPTLMNFTAAVEALGGRVVIEWPSK